MAPQNTMAVSQQQQQQTTGRNLGEQATKSKKRKGKASNSNQSAPQQQQPSKVAIADNQQVEVKQQQPLSISNPPLSKTLVKQASFEAANRQQQIEKTSLKQQQQPNQVPADKEIVGLKKKPIPIAAATVLAKQISTEESDDIDAGIELDGSSNSGSSVKDPNEDQIKSASVSPIMAQSNLINETREPQKHAIEDAPCEQLAGSLCTDIAPNKKVGSTTKQQLAANQQVIDADEQLLQQKLQSKQSRKSSTQSNISLSSVGRLNSSTTTNTSMQQSGGATPQSPALCKVCDQHVYQMERLMAEKAVYHNSCFRCYQCKIQLRINNYSSHDGKVYCKAHHKQLFQPQVKLDSEDDVDIVAKSTSKVDDYLLHRGRLSDLSFSFLQPKPEGIRKRQMIICENEPAELPKDVVRCDTKVDDGIDRLSLNLGNLKEKFERAANEENNSQPSSAGVVIEKPSYNLKKTLMAFETKSVSSHDDDDDETSKRPEKSDRPVVKKLSNLGGFLARQSSGESEPPTPTKPLAVRRSESLMMRLKKYESRIAGDQVVDDDERDEDENNNANRGSKLTGERSKATAGDENSNAVPKKLSSIDLSSLKNQWENGDISKRRFNIDDELNESGDQSTNGGKATSDNSPSAEKDEELIRIRQQLARKKSSGGSSSIKNIYENAIKEAQQQQRAAQANRLNSSDLSALNGLSTTEIQQQLLQNGSRENNRQQTSTPTSSPNKDHFQLNLGNKANKLRERFEQGLINNGSHDDSDENEADGEPPALTKLEQIRQEKLEDLSIFTEGEIKAREARSMFQQIDRRLSNGNSFGSHSRSLSSISASMQAKLQSQMNSSAANKGQVTPGIGDSTSTMVAQNGTKSVDLNASGNSNGSLSSRNSSNNHLKFNEQTTAQRPIRLQNNVRT